MKSRIALIVVFLFTTAGVLLSQNSKKTSALNTYESKEKNYLAGLNSDNLGLKTSCAYFLGEIKSQKAVIPLMKVFSEEKNFGTKLVAAWSLIKIGDARGIYQIKNAADTGDYEQIRYMLHYLYRDYDLKTQPGVIAAY